MKCDRSTLQHGGESPSCIDYTLENPGRKRRSAPGECGKNSHEQGHPSRCINTACQRRAGEGHRPGLSPSLSVPVQKLFSRKYIIQRIVDNAYLPALLWLSETPHRRQSRRSRAVNRGFLIVVDFVHRHAALLRCMTSGFLATVEARLMASIQVAGSHPHSRLKSPHQPGCVYCDLGLELRSAHGKNAQET